MNIYIFGKLFELISFIKYIKIGVMSVGNINESIFKVIWALISYLLDN